MQKLSSKNGTCNKGGDIRVTERVFKYDDNTKLLNVRAISDDSFSKEQLKDIFLSVKAQLDNADKMIKKFDDIKLAKTNMSNQPRMKELLETVMIFVPQMQIPDDESVAKTLKYWKEQKEKLEKDIKELEQFVEKEKK